MQQDAPVRVIGVPTIVGFFLKLAIWLLVLLVPVLGFWVSSSLAAYANFSVWLCTAAGLLLFPVLPLLWELRATAQHSSGPRWLPLFDRMVLRTLAINLPFCCALLLAFPERAFVALSARGDWMLEGEQSERSLAARRLLLAAATNLEGLYRLAHPNPYRQADANPEPDQGPPPVPPPPVPPGPAAVLPPAPTPSAKAPEPVDAMAWPLPRELHPAVLRIPPEAEVSVETVGNYFRTAEPDPLRRVKALHDYVADRIVYDTEALYHTGVSAAQNQPSVVLRRRKGVCMGYALLLRALGKVTGDRIFYVVGDVRDGNGEPVAGIGHAWNVAQVGDRFLLLDATWDSGTVNGETYEKGYRTDYLLTPPEIFGIDHFPEDPRWQGRAAPIDRGTFLRQPALHPDFFANGLRLQQPERSQVTVSQALDIELGNPSARYAMGLITPVHGGEQSRCAVTPGDPLRLHCELPTAGAYRVLLMVGTQRYGEYSEVGSLYANRQ